MSDKERYHANILAEYGQESLALRKTVDAYKRKALDASQSHQDLKLHLEKYLAQVKDSQSIVADKTSAWQQEAFKTKRLHEEVAQYKRKYERAKKFELATTADEVLQVRMQELSLATFWVHQLFPVLFVFL